MEIMMCYPVFMCTDDERRYVLVGVFLDLDLARARCEELGNNYHWEPWPVDCLFAETFNAN